MGGTTQKQAETDRQSAGTEAAARVADVLLMFTDAREPLGVSEIARMLGLSKAVVYRILRSLESRGIVGFNASERRYRLGPAATVIGARALRDSNLRSAALPILRRLQEETGETATVSELVGSSRAYIDQIPSRNEVKMTVEIGRRFPLHAGASSKAILAFARPEIRERVFSGPLEALTSRTQVSHRELERELRRIRSECVAASLGERQPGAGSVTAPIFGVDGYAIGSISVCAPVERLQPEIIYRLRPKVRGAAREISLKLGWDGVLPEEFDAPGAEEE